ncbi:hypothetical protein ABVT39_019559 [Epinephelus coioides]
MAARLNPFRWKPETLFKVFIAAILHFVGNSAPSGVQIIYRTDGKLFNLNRFKAKSKVLHTSIMELQYADDCAVVAHTEEDLQTTLNAFTRAYRLLALTMNIKKTEVLHQPPPDTAGNEASYALDMCSHFDADEIKRLGKRFKKLDLDNSGSLSVEEFMSLPELQQNPLVQRVIDIFDTDGNGEVDFKEFIEGVSQFSVKGDKEQKLRFAFRIYDMDKDGYISNGELFQVLKMMVGNNLKDTQLQQIVDKTIINADKDGDGRISFEEFCAVVGGLDIHKKMVVDV